MTAEASDEELIELSRSGDHDAFETFVGRHQRQVYQLCYRFVHNPEDASELAQDAFVRAYRALSGFRGESSITTWLYRIAVNVCLNRVAVKRPDRVPVSAAAEVISTSEPADLRVLREERALHVRRAIAQLPDKQRATLILRTYHDLSHDEIARILGSSAGASKANFFHALRRLRQLLNGTDDTPD